MTSARGWYTVAVLGLVYFVAFADRLALSLLVEPIRAELHVTDTQMGFLFGLSFALTLVAFSLPFGWLADRVSRRWLIAVTATLWGLLTVASGFAHSFTELLVCRIGVGIGEAGLTPAALSMISDLFPAGRRPAPVSAYLTAGIAGATGSFIVLGRLLQYLSTIAGTPLPLLGVVPAWRLALIFVGAPTVLLAVLVATTIVEPPRDPARHQPSIGDAFTYLRHRVRRYGPMFVAFSLLALLSLAASAWYPTYLIRNFGLPAPRAATMFGAAAIVGGVSGSFMVPMVLAILDRTRRRDMAVPLGLGIVATGCIAFFLSMLSAEIWSKMALMALANFCFIGGINIPAVELQQEGPANLRGQLAAIYFMCVNTCGLGLGPLTAATLASALPLSRLAFGSALEILSGGVALVALPLLTTIAARPPVHES